MSHQKTIIEEIAADHVRITNENGWQKDFYNVRRNVYSRLENDSYKWEVCEGLRLTGEPLRHYTPTDGPFILKIVSEYMYTQKDGYTLEVVQKRKDDPA